MIATIQRVDSAAVSVDKKTVGSIGQGLLVLLGVFNHDSTEDCDILAKKVSKLRVFCDEFDKMNLSLLDINGSALVVSNFTLCADTKKGNRPSFSNAKEPQEAEKLYNLFVECLKNEGVSQVQCGQFGGAMRIAAKLNGPITISLDTLQRRKGQ
ncbi:MAG: D-aminoacyl-tRNA deacylase [Oscillospiraceae bacterium]|nr:D-aminoacyl-tRNA deacylase [Oscillospiraceae bacterium]